MMPIYDKAQWEKDNPPIRPEFIRMTDHWLLDNWFFQAAKTILGILVTGTIVGCLL